MQGTDLPGNDTSRAHSDVRVVNATVELGGQLLFENLQFVGAARRWTCILGPSGVGKSTLLRMIAGLAQIAPPGRIEWRADQVTAENIAYMAQDDLLLPWLSVAANVGLGHRLRRETTNREHIRELLHRVGLGGLGNRPVDSLSGGQRQRVALARTLNEDRPIVLMDEPFSALDTITRTRLQDAASSALRGRTVILVTHDPLEALRLGHDVYVMSGRPASLGQPLQPAGAPPRPVDDPDLLRLQGELMTQLTAAASTEGWSDAS